LKSGNPDDVEQRDIDPGYSPHEILHDDLFEMHGPWHRYKKENDRKREVAEPRQAAHQKEAS